MLLCDCLILLAGVDSDALGASDWRVGFARSRLFAMRTFCSSATIMFLSAPYLKLSATTFESYF